jgi:hypothetical protein
MQTLDLELEHLDTGDIVGVTQWDYSERFNSMAMLKLKVTNAHLFTHEDLVKFSFPVEGNSSYLRTFYGIIGERSLKDKTLTAFDYGAILQNLPAPFSSNKYVGFEVISAIYNMIESEDDNSVIGLSHLHGTNPFCMVTEDDLISNNGSVRDAMVKLLPLAFDSSNDWYILPYHYYFHEDQLVIEKRQNIEDSATFPSCYTLTNANLFNAVLREDDKDVANYVKCDGFDGATVSVEDQGSTTPFLTNSFPQKYKVIEHGSKHTDDLHQQAVNYILLNRILRGEYEITPIDTPGMSLNTIINISSDEFGIDGRFVITGIRYNSKMRMKVTISGQQLAIADVL